MQLLADKGAATRSDYPSVGEIANFICQRKHPGHFRSCCKSVSNNITALPLVFPPTHTPHSLHFFCSPLFPPSFWLSLVPRGFTQPCILSFQIGVVRSNGNLPISRYACYLWDKMVSLLLKQWGSCAISPFWIILHFFPSFMVCCAFLSHQEIRKCQGIFHQCWQTAEIWLAIVNS